MGIYFNLARRTVELSSNYQKKRQSSRKFLNSPSTGKLVLSQKALSATLLILIIILGVGYITLVNARATKGFEIKKLEQSLTELQRQTRELEKKTTERQSIQNLEQSVNITNLVPTGEVTYLSIPGVTALKSSPSPY